MKKIANQLMVMLLITVMLVGCGKEMLVSDLNISTLKSEFINNIDKASLSETEIDNGYEFEGTADYISSKIRIKGMANSEKNIANIEMTISECVDINYFETLTFEQFSEDLLENPEHVTEAEFCTLGFVFYASELIPVMNDGANGKSDIEKYVSFILGLKNGKKESNGWKYSLVVNKSTEMITLTAEYVGEKE
ncbi:MAG: hypothetical protein IJF18_07515 [Oscillospiraceae bacterium]|nr:hypothetical protein [Oscillospiraceae bacterium]